MLYGRRLERVPELQLCHYKSVKFRADIVNLFDRVYLLREGTGIGVGAPQYGNRRGFYGGLALDF
jgi:outer membrane receptor protein involved in Fe transport